MHTDHTTPMAGAPLDGNAGGGLLSQLFAIDVTTARLTCASCGIAAHVAEAGLYGGPMGAVFRCAHCGAVVMRFASTPHGCWLDMRGALSLHVPAHVDRQPAI